jgi:poly-gamma-glutamate synthesis protein (capsule biosynthesis protein)
MIDTGTGKASLFMAGDVTIHKSVYDDALTADGSYDFKPMLQHIKPLSAAFDLAYYNQESLLGGTALGLSEYPRFNSPHETGDAFIDAGFNLVSLANNHVMDMGEQGVLSSIGYWNQHKDHVVYAGQWASSEERKLSSSAVHEINGLRYAFLSYTMWTNGVETPPGKEYYNNVYSDRKAYEDIINVRDKTDLIIVAMHWGEEYYHGVLPEQERIADYLSGLGVGLIIGAHPHVVEPVEYRNNGKTFVIYSLGNLLSGQTGIDKNTGLLMSVDLIKTSDGKGDVSVKIENPRAELVFNQSFFKDKRSFRLYPSSMLNDAILDGYKALNYHKQIVASRCPELKWGFSF